MSAMTPWGVGDTDNGVSAALLAKVVTATPSSVNTADPRWKNDTKYIVEDPDDLADYSQEPICPDDKMKYTTRKT